MEITLTKAANVRLLDSLNFRKYKKGQKHRYQGGLVRRSPARLQIPRSGRWHTVVDMQGLRGSTKASVRVIDAAALRPLPPLPPLRQSPTRQDIAEVFDNAASLLPERVAKYDVFISHAGEDKDAIVRPLAHALRERGVSVWYDEFSLRVGDSLRRSIDLGISNSRFGLVVLSKPFFAKGWSQYELDGLVSLAVRRPAGDAADLARDYEGRGDAAESIAGGQGGAPDGRAHDR